MKVKIKKGVMNGNIHAISSKSYAHRYIIASMLSKQNSLIKNIYLSEDIKATLACLKCFDKEYTISDDLHISNKVFNCDKVFDCNESGSTLRFLIPIALVKFGKAKFIGTESLFKRGLDVYLDIFKENNIDYKLTKTSLEFSGTLHNNEFCIPGNVSSQFLTGLLFSLPMLQYDSTIQLTTELESKSYIDITLDVLKKCGINILVKDNIYYVKGNQTYNFNETIIEGDFSNASYFQAFNYLGSNINIEGLNMNSLQGDKVGLSYFKELNNKYCTIDISNCIDLGPVLFTFASIKHGARFINVNRLKIKESDRVNSIVEELNKCGANIKVLDNEVVIKQSTLYKPSESLFGHNDHRIVMSLTLLSSLFDIEINGYDAVNKSYPTYFQELKKLGLKLEE